jgi:hypothetical protein
MLNVFVKDLELTNPTYLYTGVVIYPLYIVLSLIIAAQFIVKIIGLKVVEYFYKDESIQYLNVLDLILFIADLILTVISLVFFILTFSNVKVINYLIFGVFIVIRLLIVRIFT